MNIRPVSFCFCLNVDFLDIQILAHAVWLPLFLLEQGLLDVKRIRQTVGEVERNDERAVASFCQFESGRRRDRGFSDTAFAGVQ